MKILLLTLVMFEIARSAETNESNKIDITDKNNVHQIISVESSVQNPKKESIFKKQAMLCSIFKCILFVLGLLIILLIGSVVVLLSSMYSNSMEINWDNIMKCILEVKQAILPK